MSLKRRTKKKLLKYIEKDELPKLKSYIKKHKADVNVSLTDSGDTMLYVACQLGLHHTARWLLKKGADPMLCNVHGDLPLHAACHYALEGDTKAYTELVLPLIKLCKRSLDFANSHSVTPRSLLKDIHLRLRMTLEISDTETSSSDESGGYGIGDEREETRWSERLAEEMQEECVQEEGAFQSEYYREMKQETWDDWAEKISSQHQRNRYSDPPSRTYSKHRRKAGIEDTATEPKKRKGIDEAKRKEFDRKLREDALQEIRVSRERQQEKWTQIKVVYESRCDAVFGGGDGTLLRYRDIPWPPGKTLQDKANMMFSGLQKDSTQYRKYVKEQQRRWHPDRFSQKCGSRLVETDRHKIMESVKELSQYLNKMAEPDSK